MQPVHQQTVAVDRAGDAVLDRLLGALAGKGAEQPVEDDKDATVVGVDVARITGVMNPMVVRRVEQVLDHRVQFADQCGVDEKLIDQ